MPESVDFCWSYICHNDYQELHCIVETGILLLCVLLPGFDMFVLMCASKCLKNIFSLSQPEATQTCCLSPQWALSS